MDDLDPTLVRQAPVSKEAQEYQMKYLCDETTYMMFDLERGRFIKTNGELVAIDDLWSFSYTRKLVEETIENGIQNIISNFFVKVMYNDEVVFDYEVYGNERRFKVNKVSGFHTGMFLEELDKFRKSKFDIKE